MEGYTDITIKRTPAYRLSQDLVDGDFQVHMSRNRNVRIQKMLHTKAAKIENIIEGSNVDADTHLKKHLPIINCECGAEILVVPDLQAMNRAIKAHVAEHREKERNAQKNVKMSSKIGQLLSQLTLIRMSEKNGA